MPLVLRRRPIRVVLITILAALVAVVGASCGSASASGPTIVHVSSTAAGGPIPDGFLGLSMEYRGLPVYAGTSATNLDQPFLQLVRNLTPGGHPLLRVGGDSTDWTWWPVPGMAKPGGVRFALTPAYTSVAKAVAQAIGGHFIFGINFEADNRRLAAFESNQLLAHIGGQPITAFELGNEPELYDSFPWFKTATGQHVFGRARGYSPTSYLSDFAHIAAGLPRGVPVAGPSSGSTPWLSYLGQFATQESRLDLLTVHAYPLKHCGAATFASAGDFFVPASLQDLASLIGSWVAVGRGHHLPVRVDEMNSISCGGQRGLSQAFAPALWALDMLPRLVRVGVAGVNFHTVPNTNQSLVSASFSQAGWRVQVEPEYYGLMMFALAAPTGSHLLRLSASGPSGIDEWAARTPAGQVNVVLINTSGGSRRAKVKLAATVGSATVTRLAAPGMLATSRVTLGGEEISSTTGLLSGLASHPSITAIRGTYAVSVPAASAVMLSFAG